MIEPTSAVPIPDDMPRAKGSKKYPFETMAVGESFLAPGVKPASFMGYASVQGKRLGRIFRCRTQERGVRCWRVA